MARYRPLYKSFWKDPDIQDLTPDKKLLHIYLFGNEAVTESGIYHVTPKTISDETGLDIEWVKEQLARGFARNILYDPSNRLIFIRKIRKYNTGGSPKLIEKSILTDFNLTSYSNLWREFIVEYPQYKQLLNGCPTVDEPLPRPAEEEPKTDTTKLSFNEYINGILRGEEKYASLDIDEELRKFNLYNTEKHREVKKPKFAFRNWLNNELKYAEERKENGTHQRSTKRPRSQPERYTKPNEL